MLPEIPETLINNIDEKATSRWQCDADHLTPLEKQSDLTIQAEGGFYTDMLSPLSGKVFEAPKPTPDHIVHDYSSPLEIWEGTVNSIDFDGQTMEVTLIAKIGDMPRHSAEISLEWVAEQDNDLLRPGAVFYLTLFKRSKRSGVENAQELRFRRRPSWGKHEIDIIDKEAATLLSRMTPLAMAE